MSPGVISLMNPGPYRPLCVGGWHVGGFQTNRPSPGGSSSRPMVARPVRYGPVRQKTNFYSSHAQRAARRANSRLARPSASGVSRHRESATEDAPPSPPAGTTFSTTAETARFLLHQICLLAG